MDPSESWWQGKGDENQCVNEFTRDKVYVLQCKTQYKLTHLVNYGILLYKQHMYVCCQILCPPSKNDISDERSELLTQVSDINLRRGISIKGIRQRREKNLNVNFCLNIA